MPDLTPAGWLEVLEKRLNDRWFRRMGAYDAYYEGDHRLAFATAQWREAFAGVFAAPSDNWMPLVVDASAERLEVQGFRFGKEQAADEDAWAIWQENALDGQHKMLHTEAIKLGEAYWMVEPPPRGSDDPPRITVECPSQVIVATAPGDLRRRLAALKKWAGDDGYGYANVYLPEALHKFRSQQKLRQTTGGRINWMRRADDPGGENRLGEVPVIPVRNNPQMRTGGRSDLKDGMSVQDAINKLLSDMLIGAEYQAFPQRVLLGVEIPKDPTTGQPIRATELQASKSRLWAFANEDAKVAEFKAADLKNYIEARDHLVENLAAKTKTPLYYVTGKMVNVSGDALKAADTGATLKAGGKTVNFGESHEEMARLSLKATGRNVTTADTETIWKDVESRSFGELIDGLVKLKALNVPDEVLWEKAKFSPQEISRMKTMQMADALFAAPEPPAAAPAAPPVG